MKIIHSNPQRIQESGVIYQSGGFAYRLDTQWAKLPDHLKGAEVLSGCCDREGNVIVSTGDRRYPLMQFTPEGKFARSFGEGLFSRAHSVFVTQQNTILVADSSKTVRAVREITMEGELVRNFGELGMPSNSGINTDAFMQLKRDGKLAVDAPWSDNDDFFACLDTIQHAAGPFNRPCAMVAGLNGEMFAADGYGNAAVHKFAADGTYLKTWGGPGTAPGCFRLPHGIWVDRKGRVWVADRENSRVQVYNTGGELLYVADGFYRAADVWADADNIYVGELRGGLTIFNMDMEITVQLGYFGSPLFIHGLCGNAKSDLFIFTIFHHKYHENVIKLTRI
jgi:hypothetical protein